MTVRELIDMLSSYPSDMDSLVILSSDSEGNKMSPLSKGYGDGYYIPDTPYRGEVVDDKDEFNCDGVKCIVLYPIS